MCPPEPDPAAWAPLLEEALAAGGVAGVILPAAAAPAAVALRPLCHAHGAALLVEGADAAAAMAADGLVLAGDGVAAARAALGPQRILAVVTAPTRHALMVAGEEGADVVVAGGLDHAGAAGLVDLVEWWSEVAVLPIAVAAPGDAADIGALVAAGADFLAVGAAIWQHPLGPRRATDHLLEAIAAARLGARP